MIRFLRRLPGRTVRGVLILAFVAIALVFAVTRTQVGRDTLARQIEEEFGQSFDGQLSIGRLTGNMLQEFTAADVVVLDSAGVESIRIDSVRIESSWEDLVRRRVVVPRIEFIRPRITYGVDATGRPMLPGLAVAISGTDSSTAPWEFRYARLVISDGSASPIPRPEASPSAAENRFSNLTIRRVYADALLDWSEAQRHIDVLSAFGEVSDPDLSIRGLEAQLLVENDRVRVNRAVVELAQTRLEIDGSIDLAAGREAAFDLSIQSPQVSFDEVRPLFPGSPLSGTASVSLRASGSTRGIAVSQADLRSGSTRVSLSGTVVGLPDSADFDLTLDRMRLRSDDLRQLLPGATMVTRLRFDSLDGSGTARGVYKSAPDAGNRLQVDGQIAFASDAGSASSAFSIRLPEEGEPQVRIDADAAGLDLAAFAGASAPYTNLAGTLEWTGAGLDPATATGTVRVELNRSVVGTSRIERLGFQASATSGPARFDINLDQGEGGWLRADGLLNRGPTPALSIDAMWNRFDAGPLTGLDSLVTLSTGRASGRFTGTDEATLAGSLEASVDSARIRLRGAETTAPAQSVRVDLAAWSPGVPRVRVTSDAGTATLSGDVQFGAIAAVGAFWVDALAGAVRREADKPYPGLPADPVVGLVENARDIQTALLRGQAERRLFESLDGQPLDLHAEVDLGRLDLVASWWPGSPPVDGSIALELHSHLDPDSLSFTASLVGDSLRVGSLHLDRPRARFGLATRYEGPVEHDAILDIRIAADSVVVPGVLLPDPVFELRLAGGRGSAQIGTGRSEDIGPLILNADLLLLDESNLIRLNSASVDARNYAWSLVQPAEIGLYTGGITVSPMRIESGPVAGLGRQALSIAGALSAAPGDSMSVSAESILLEDLTRFATLNPSLGGRLDGRIVYTRAVGRPVVSGAVRAQNFVMDGRLLGDLALESRLVPGSPEVAVSLDLTPPDTASVRIGTPPEEIRRNLIHISGTVRLPDESAGDPGSWNLTADVPRADLFFLKYVFTSSIDRADGYLSGGGTVSGVIRRPVFDMGFTAHDGRFGIPVTGGRYTLEGELSIDEEAIRFEPALVADAGGGRAVVTGSLLFNEYQFFSFDLQAALEEFQILNVAYTEEIPFYGFVRGSGTAFLTGPLAAATLRVPDGVTRADSELSIPIVESTAETDDSFIVFADSSGQLPDLRELARRPFLLASRATVERRFLDGLQMDLNLFAPRGSLVRLVIDPLLGDVINAESTGRMQIRRDQGEFEIFGTLEVEGGDYLFTAGEVFVRRFLIEDGGTIIWDSDPIDARLDIPAVYRTRASSAGLDAVGTSSSALIPLIVQLQITGSVLSPAVDLALAIDRSNQNVLGDYQALEARLNNPERSAEYATSVLLTNSFQLTTESLDSSTGEQLAFNSVSQLVSAQLNRFLNAALPNVDVNFGLQGERAEDLDITYGVALRLLDERLIIRGEGIYQGSRTDVANVAAESLQGEVVVEVRLNPSVSVEVFFRREGDVLQSADLTNTAGAGVSYQTEFSSWGQFFRRLFGWLTPNRTDPEEQEAPSVSDES